MVVTDELAMDAHFHGHDRALSLARHCVCRNHLLGQLLEDHISRGLTRARFPSLRWKSSTRSLDRSDLCINFGYSLLSRSPINPVGWGILNLRMHLEKIFQP